MKTIFTPLVFLVGIGMTNNTMNAQTYCTPAMSISGKSGITNVTLKEINRTSANNEGYVNTGKEAMLYIDSSYTLSVTFMTAVSIPNDMSAPEIWIDWNSDLDFSDAGEKITNSAWYPCSGTKSLKLTVPSTATKGFTRMRVYSKIFGTGPATDPCATTDQGGDIEDYFLIIQELATSVQPQTDVSHQKTISVYPNPGNAIFYINLPENTTNKIVVANVLGQVVTDFSTNGKSSIPLDLSDFNNGIYFVSVSNDEGRQTIKVIKE